MSYSMTGFGAAEGPVAGRRLRVEIRTVNHRYFNLSAKLPGDLTVLEGELRERLRRDFDRGHVAVQARWTESAERETGGSSVDLERARLVAARLREMQSALGLGGEVTVELVARQPEVLELARPTAPARSPGARWSRWWPRPARSAGPCGPGRARRSTAELGHRLRPAGAVGRSRSRRGRRSGWSGSATGSAARSAELLDGRTVDEERLAQELAFLADKLDITEELVRFRAHVAAAREALAADKPVGKQLGFLAQELGREVNTMGAKAGDAEIAQQVIAMKGELEKFREQLENLE